MTLRPAHPRLQQELLPSVPSGTAAHRRGFGIPLDRRQAGSAGRGSGPTASLLRCHPAAFPGDADPPRLLSPVHPLSSALIRPHIGTRHLPESGQHVPALRIGTELGKDEADRQRSCSKPVAKAICTSPVPAHPRQRVMLPPRTSETPKEAHLRGAEVPKSTTQAAADAPGQTWPCRRGQGGPHHLSAGVGQPAPCKSGGLLPFMRC